MLKTAQRSFPREQLLNKSDKNSSNPSPEEVCAENTTYFDLIGLRRN